MFLTVWVVLSLLSFIMVVFQDFVMTKKENRFWVKGPVADTFMAFVLALMFGPIFFVIVSLATISLCRRAV